MEKQATVYLVEREIHWRRGELFLPMAVFRHEKDAWAFAKAQQAVHQKKAKEIKASLSHLIRRMEVK